jgi:superfamily II DNA/RNA helicase
MQFSELIDHPQILQAINDLGHTTPTPIQEMTIPEAIAGKDLLASAQTGTGKTASFLIPTLMKMTNPSPIAKKGPRVLILVPTRELACQVKAEAIKYSKHLAKVKTVCIYGGVPYPVQFKELSRHYEILVATPGRLMDHIERGKISLEKVEVLVLDEADRMLDMGFIGAVEEIATLLPENRQTLFFSATFKKNVVSLAKKLLKNPVEIQASHPHEKHENIEQKLLKANNLEHKYTLLDNLLKESDLNQVIIFTSTKRQADTLMDRLVESGEEVGVLHGDIKQKQRTRTVNRLKDGDIRVLVATDVAARGIDIPTISHVINFDLPTFAEDYVHRIGRTGRAGAKGTAFSFVSKREFYMVKEIEKFTGQKLSSEGEFEEKTSKKPSDRAPKERVFKEKSFKEKSFDEKPFQKERSFKEKTFGDKPFSKERSFKEKSFGDKPFSKDRSFKEKSFGDKPFSKDRSFKEKTFGDKPFSKERSFKEKTFGDKPFSKERSFKEKTFGDKPFSKERSFGDKPFKKFEKRRHKPRNP